jgi:hypothetical protein
MMVKLLKDKGYDVSFLEDEDNTNKGKFNKININKEDIMKTKDVPKKEFIECLKNQQRNMASMEDKLIVERYMLKLDLGVDKLTDELIEKYYGKSFIVKNYRCLLNSNNLDIYVKKDDNKKSDDDKIEDKIINHDFMKQKEKINMITEIIKLLGFKSIEDKTLIEKTDFLKSVENVKTKSKLFTQPNISQPLFEFEKSKLYKVLNKDKLKTKNPEDNDENKINLKSFLGFINSICSDYGFEIILKQKTKKVNEKYISINYYYIKYLVDEVLFK